jgi:tetratricopeptide (TPR) repeat protein
MRPAGAPPAEVASGSGRGAPAAARPPRAAPRRRPAAARATAHGPHVPDLVRARPKRPAAATAPPPVPPAAAAPPPPPPEAEDSEDEAPLPGPAPAPPARGRLAMPPPPAPPPRDAEGRPLLGRPRSLKINLDLALYNARRARIRAQRAGSPKERAALLRGAEAQLRACLEADPSDGRPYVSLGRLLLAQRRDDEAAALYEAGAAATRGANAHVWAAWAHLAARRGRAAQARKLFDAAVVAAPDHAAAYHGWGMLEKKEGRYAAARDVWVRGLRACAAAPSPYLYQSLAVLAAELERPDEARRWFEAGTATIRGKQSGALWQAWALLEARARAPAPRVRGLFAAAAAASPSCRYVFTAWARWEAASGDLEEARRLFRRGAYLCPSDAALFQAWAMAEARAGAPDAARALLRRASKIDPGHVPVWQAWGVLEARAGACDAARELFQQGVWAAPPRARSAALCFQAWGVLEREAGNVELARELFRCAVKADPRSAPSWLAWAAMEEEGGDLLRAQELRGYALQERVEVAAPAGFSTLPRAGGGAGVLAPLFAQVARWVRRYEGLEDAAPPPPLEGAALPTRGGGGKVGAGPPAP